MEGCIYRYKGNDYKYLGIGKFKNDFDGAWIDAVLYEREGHKYMREVKDFFKKFEDVSSPLYSDYEAMSSDESCIVEKRRNRLYAYYAKCFKAQEIEDCDRDYTWSAWTRIRSYGL